MSQTQLVNRPAAATMPSDDDFQRLLERDAKTIVSYIPYGAQDQIKLTATNVQNLIAVRTKQGHTCSTRDALKFIAMCQAKRLNPFEGDCFLIGYDTQQGPSFALVTAHQTYLKRAELHDEFDGMTSGLIVKSEEDGKLSEIEGDFFEEGQQVVGGWAKVHFKNRKHPMYKRLRMARFNKGVSIWRDDAAGMICKCAEADALRSAFPTMLGGLYMQEERELEQKPKVSKPEFSPTPLFTAPESKVPTPEPVQETEPESGLTFHTGRKDSANESEPQTEPEPPNPSSLFENNNRYLNGVRALCKMAKIKEVELLLYLVNEQAIDGSEPSLDEVNGDVLKSVHDNWSGANGVSTKILAAKGGAK